MTYLLKDALLQNYNPDVLEAILGGNRKGSPAEMSAAAAERLLDPEIMRNRMVFLHDNDISFFEYACRGSTAVARANFTEADRIMRLSYGFASDLNMTFRIPDDVAEQYSKISDDEFHERRRKMSWLQDCAGIVPMFYGIISVGDFGRLYRRNRSRSETDEEIILGMLPDLIRYGRTDLRLNGNELASSDLVSSANAEKIRQLHKEYPVSFPTYAEIRNITDDFYPSSLASYKKLRQQMIRIFSYDAAQADAVMEVVFFHIAVGVMYDDIIRFLNEHGFTVSETQKKQLRPYMLEAWMDTRCLMFNGACPRKAAPHMSYIF